jgi:hypothetical protein
MALSPDIEAAIRAAARQYSDDATRERYAARLRLYCEGVAPKTSGECVELIARAVRAIQQTI